MGIARAPMLERQPGDEVVGTGASDDRFAALSAAPIGLLYVVVGLLGMGLYLTVWVAGFWPGPWPPSSAMWANLYLASVVAIGILAIPRRGHLLLAVTIVAAVLLAVVVSVRAGVLPAVAALAWLALIGVGLGSSALRLIAPTVACAWIERLALSLLLGLGMLALVGAALAFAGLLSPAVTIATLALLTISIGRLIPGWVRDSLPGARRLFATRSDTDLRLPALGLACLVLCFAGALLWAVAPSVHWDALVYHLAVPAADAADHGFINRPYYAGWHLIGQAHTLYTLAFVLTGQPLPSLLHFTIGAATTALVFSLGRCAAGSIAGWTSAVAFASMPLVTWEAGTAYIDLFVTAYYFAAVYVLLRWWHDDQPGWLPIGGMFGGLAIGTKLNAALLLLPALLFVFVVVVIRRRHVPTLLLHLLSLGVPLATIPLPWLIRNWVTIGQRALPFSLSIAESAQLPPEWTMSDRFGAGKGFAELARLPYDLIVNGSRFDEIGFGPFGIVPLLGLAAPLAWRWVPTRVWLPMLLIALSGVVLWFRAVQVDRYLLPVMPMLAVLAVLPLPGLLRALTVRRAAPIGALVFGVLGLGYVSATRGVHSRWGFQIEESYPYRLALGRESRDDFLGRALTPYRALRFVDAEAGSSARILAAAVPFHVYFAGTLDDDIESAEARALAALPPGPDLARELADRGYDFIMVNWAQMRHQPRPLPYIDPQFLRDFTRLVFAHRDVYVYRLATGGLADAPGRNIVKNDGFDDAPEGELPSDWVPFGAPHLVRDADRAHSALAFVEATHNDALYQLITVQPNRLYTVRLWARAQEPGQSVWLQILWFDAQRHVLDIGIESVGVEPEWRPFEASFTAVHPTATAGWVYARAAPGSRVWLDDVRVIEQP